MKTLAVYENDKLFSAIRVIGSGADESGALYAIGKRAVQFICPACESGFLTCCGFPNTVYHFSVTELYHCPLCGRSLSLYDNCTAVEYWCSNNRPLYIPYKIRLSLKEYKNFLDLDIVTVNARLDMEKFALCGVRRRLKIRFDCENHSVEVLRAGGQRLERLGMVWPFRVVEGDVPEGYIRLRDTPLRYLSKDSSIHGEERKKLDAFIRALYAAVTERLEKRVGHKIRSVYVPSNGGNFERGMLEDPLANLAWRWAFPEGRNLTRGERLFTPDKDEILDLMNLMDRGRHGEPYVYAMKGAYRLPGGKKTLSLLPTVPLMDLDNLKQLGVILKTPEYFVEGAAKCLQTISRHKTISCPFTIALLRHRGSAAVKNFVMKLLAADWGTEEDDMTRTYDLLTDKNKALFWAQKPRSRDMHDALTRLYDKQVYTDIPLHYDAEERNMEKEVDGFLFRLPKSTGVIRETGRRMHNCVGSYCDRVRAKDSLIVVGYKDHTPKICIEVRRRSLIQAKLFANKAVSRVPDVNAAVVTWAKQCGISYNTTSDVREVTS